jgi:hypothetical protein
VLLFSLTLVFLSLSLLVRVSLISEGLSILFLTKQVSHEMLHHVEFQIFFELLHVAEPPELFQLKCLRPALKARPHLNRNKTSIPRI